MKKPFDQISIYERALSPEAARAAADARAEAQSRLIAPQRHGDRGDHDGGDPDADAPPRRFLTGPQVCARYSITDMSLWRWLKDPTIGFPPPALRVKDRRYWLESELLAWERAQLPRCKPRLTGTAP